MRWPWIATIVVAMMVCGSAMAAEPAARPAEKVDMAEFVDGINAFGLRMYGQLSGEKGNVFFSPLSLHAALSMTSVGAKGETHAEMAKTLGLPTGEADAVGGAYAAFFERLFKDAARISTQELSIANGLWVSKQARLVEGFATVMQRDFQSESSTVDFSKPAEAVKLVNGWVAKRTKDRIQDILAPDALTRDTMLVLANALYFKNAWAEEFSKNRTADGDFKLGGGKTGKAKMMFRQSEYDYAETDDAQVLSMPYMGHRFSMVFVLPKQDDGLAELEKKLSPDTLTAWTNFTSSDVRVTLPRFTVTRDFQARKPLEALGMKRAFVGGKNGADFSGMVADEPVWIGFVVHKAFVAVDEVGTEAAAATVIGIVRGAAPLEPDEPKEFNADHPFLFMIRHNPIGTVLFMGRLADPSSE